MCKKVFHVLTREGWLRRVGRGKYRCVRPEEVFRRQFEFKVPGFLEAAKRPWCFTGASAVEIWTDFSQVQRSWEYSPYFIKVRRRDLLYWKEFFRKRGIGAFVEGAGSAIGEFVVLEPVERLDHVMHGGWPVDRLERVVKFCEHNSSTFEYPLACLIRRYGLQKKVDHRVMEKAAEVL
jgi:hypothetical protein